VRSLYRQPNTDITYLENLCNALQGMIENNPDCVVWIAGDANFPNIDWELVVIITQSI